jgi:hypothetical protein
MWRCESTHALRIELVEDIGLLLLPWLLLL